MVDGSAVNCAITGAPEGGGGAVVVDPAEGGGGGADVMGAFFLHPAANPIKKTLIKILAQFLLLNLNSSISKSLAPDRHGISALGSELLYLCTVSQHCEDLHRTAIPIGSKNQMPPVRPPIWILIAARTVR
jgi:hypothetical protein